MHGLSDLVAVLLRTHLKTAAFNCAQISVELSEHGGKIGTFDLGIPISPLARLLEPLRRLHTIAGVSFYWNHLARQGTDFDLRKEDEAMRYTLAEQNFCLIPDGRSQQLTTLLDHFHSNPEPIKTLILCHQQYVVEKICFELNHATLIIPAEEVHGDLPQTIRENSVTKFKKGYIPVLVSIIYVSGRGIKFKRIGQVIFYNIPETVEQYN